MVSARLKGIAVPGIAHNTAPFNTGNVTVAATAFRAQATIPQPQPQGAPFNQPVTHGDQLTLLDVGPWALQEIDRGTEALLAVSGPGRGFWRFDTPDEFSSTTAWPSNANDSNPSILNDPDLHYGTVTGSPVTIDGYSIPVGTRIVQFVEFPDGYDFYAQGTNLQVLFRGCRFRFTATMSGAGLFNDNGANAGQRIYMHYCDVGGASANLPDGATGLMHIKNLGGANHRYLRGYHSYSSTFFQPNVQGCQFIENYVTDYVFAYGEAGPSGSFDSSVYHNNGISCEGGLTSITILRNRIVCPSPDPATGSGATAAGEIGYGTQPGQTGYGSGTAPGRIIGQTDCIALFESNGSPNQGTAPGSILVQDNLLGGSGYCLYAGEEDAGNGAGQNIHVIGNKFTTRWWTNGGQFGAIAATPQWGSNGNYQADNTWADDYGTGGNGSTATASRQYPNGDGPRSGTSIFADRPAAPPTGAFTEGTQVGVPTGTTLTTRTALGSPTSTGSYTLVDPRGIYDPVTVAVDIYEAIQFTTNRIVAHRTTGNVRLFRNCRFNIANETSMVECDEEGTGGTSGYMTPRTIFERCTFDGDNSTGKALSGGNLWAIECHIADCEDGTQGPFSSVFNGCNIIGGTDGLTDPHADGFQLLGIGKTVVWNCYVSAGTIPGAASQALRIGAEFGGNDDVTIGWCRLDGGAGGWTLQARGDNNPTEDNTNIRVHDTVVLPGGFGSVDFVESAVAQWERVYSDSYGGTPIANPAP